MQLHLVSTLARAYFVVYDSSDVPVTGLADGAFTKLLAKDSATDATAVTIVEIGGGRYVATFTPATIGVWHVVVRHATYNPRGWDETIQVTNNGSEVITTASSNKIADHILRRTYAAARASADGDAVSYRSLLGAIAKLVNKVSIAGVTLTVFHEDDVTATGTQALTVAPGADPISGMDTT